MSAARPKTPPGPSSLLPVQVETTSSLGIKTHYVQYVVRTDSVVPGMLAEGLEVKRRFSDFDVRSAAPGWCLWGRGAEGLEVKRRFSDFDVSVTPSSALGAWGRGTVEALVGDGEEVKRRFSDFDVTGARPPCSSGPGGWGREAGARGGGGW